MPVQVLGPAGSHHARVHLGVVQPPFAGRLPPGLGHPELWLAAPILALTPRPAAQKPPIAQALLDGLHRRVPR
eukprot:7620716-Pyramimonas_sp.AAC.1